MKPLYRIIMEELTSLINSGSYRPNEKLPSESELMNKYNTSRITVTRALRELELKGLIYKIKGKGSFVSSRKSRDSKIISLVLPHKEGFFSGGQQYIRSITSASNKKGYLCSVHYSEQSSAKERLILEDLERHEVSGVILYPIDNRNIDIISKLSIESFPITLLDRPLQELELPVVVSENREGAKSAVNYILENGHKNIAFIGVLDAESAVERYKGYCNALIDFGFPIDPNFIYTAYPCEPEDDQAVLSACGAGELVESMMNQGVTACFCVNDLSAYRIADAASSAGLRVPDDLSIAGFDNMLYLNELGIELTSVAQNYEKIGYHSVDLLVSLIENPSYTVKDIPSRVNVETELIKGSTVKKIN